MTRFSLRNPLVALLAAASVCFPQSSRPQTAYPFLYSLYPCGLQRGTTTEVTLTGLHNYHSAYKVIVEGKGVTGEVVVPAAGWPKEDEKTKAVPVVNEIKLKITAAADAAVGVRELRVATPRGVSSIGQLVIGDEPEMLEKEPNNTQEQAQEIKIPTTVNGRIQQGEDVDTYKVKVQAGEEITFAVACARLEDKIHDLQEHADPMLTLRDSTGRELAANDDYYRADPLLHYRFEKAGDYYIQIRDVSYKGNPYWTYRLTATSRPYVTAFLPMGAKPGTAVDVTPVGFGLQGKNCRLEIPMDSPMGEQYVQLKTPMGLSNPVPVLVTDLPATTIASAPAGDAAMPLSIPAAVTARLSKPGESHRHKFHAKAGQMFRFEVNARRYDSRIDSVLTLMNDKGQEITSNDDALGPDSRIDWQAGSDGDYLLEVRDLHGRGGDGFVYLLTAKPMSPDFRLRCDDDKMKLGPGNSGAWYLLVDRVFGFNSPITVEVKGLPPGVTATPLTIPPNIAQGCVVLTCASDAKVNVGEVEVVGTATANGVDGKPATVTHRAVPMSEIYLPGGGRAVYEVNTQAVAVTDPSDIVVELSTASVTLAPGGTVKIDVNVKRKPGYTKAVTLDVYLRHLGSVYGNPLPPGVSLDEGASKTLLGENETKGHIVLKANADAQAVTNLPIAILGQVSINFVVKVSYAGPPVLLTVTPKK